MRAPQDIARFIGRQPRLMALLAAVEGLRLPDCWIAAGLIRNAVWDHLHGRAPVLHAGSDVDVVYFDASGTSMERDTAIEARLAASCPGVPWSVHNQARMHTRNGDRPYVDVADAMRRWPETATAVAARTLRRTPLVLAPLGVEDLVGLIVRPTPAFTCKIQVYQARIASKDWAARWPKLTFAVA